MRSSIVIWGDPPVVILTTALVDCFILGKNCSYTLGSCDGFPVSGSLACKCKIAAPASAAAIAASAISPGVTGKCADILGV